MFVSLPDLQIATFEAGKLDLDDLIVHFGELILRKLNFNGVKDRNRMSPKCSKEKTEGSSANSKEFEEDVMHRFR